MTFLHFADLHVSVAEKNYSLSVLDELIAIARDSGVTMMISAGDLFDSYEDARALKDEVSRRLSAFATSGREVVLLAGNHEALGFPADSPEVGKNDLQAAWPPGISWIDGDTWQIHRHGDGEIVCIPWKAIPRLTTGDSNITEMVAGKKGYRVTAFHGSVAGFIFTGLGQQNETDIEEFGVPLDQTFFSGIETDYAALGHIHKGRAESKNGTLFCYPGSARIWRLSETGPRVCSLVTSSSQKFITLRTAGQVRRETVILALDGQPLKRSIDAIRSRASVWESADRVVIGMAGIVARGSDIPDGRKLTEILPELSKVRSVKIEQDPERLKIIGDAVRNPIIRRFLDEVENRLKLGTLDETTAETVVLRGLEMLVRPEGKC